MNHTVELLKSLDDSYGTERNLNHLLTLSSTLGIQNTLDLNSGLVILNYHDGKSRGIKRHPVVEECRGLTLDLNTWTVVARAFKRFFNVGEYKDLDNRFQWNNFTATLKHDGSLVLLYYYQGSWRWNSRGSFGGHGWDKKAKDLINSWMSVRKHKFNSLSKHCTYVMEFVSPYHQIVTRYQDSELHLLAVVDNETGEENDDLDSWRKLLLLPANNYRPVKMASREQLISALEALEQVIPDAEGYVIKDNNGLRLKAKTTTWNRLHKECNNRHYSNEVILDKIMDDCLFEFLRQFPDAQEKAEGICETWAEILGQTEDGLSYLKSQVGDGPTTGPLATYVIQNFPLAFSLIFTGHRNQKSGMTLMKNYRNHILKVIRDRQNQEEKSEVCFSHSEQG